MKTENTKEKTEKTEKKYEISIDFGDTVAKASASTLFDALLKLQKPTKIVGKTFISIKEGKRRAELMFMPAQAKRLYHPLAQYLYAKKFELLLK